MEIRLGDLKPGQYRKLTEGELGRLGKMLEQSSNMPAGQRKEMRTGDRNHDEYTGKHRREDKRMKSL